MDPKSQGSEDNDPLYLILPGSKIKNIPYM